MKTIKVLMIIIAFTLITLSSFAAPKSSETGKDKSPKKRISNTVKIFDNNQNAALIENMLCDSASDLFVSKSKKRYTRAKKYYC